MSRSVWRCWRPARPIWCWFAPGYRGKSGIAARAAASDATAGGGKAVLDGGLDPRQGRRAIRLALPVETLLVGAKARDPVPDFGRKIAGRIRRRRLDRHSRGSRSGI